MLLLANQNYRMYATETLSASTAYEVVRVATVSVASEFETKV